MLTTKLVSFKLVECCSSLPCLSSLPGLSTLPGPSTLSGPFLNRVQGRLLRPKCRKLKNCALF